MAVFLSPVGGAGAQFFDNNGSPLNGGKIYTYAAGTTTPQATYTSSSGGTAHSNPIILDSAGRIPGGETWITEGVSYKFVIKTSTDVLIGTYDDITSGNANANNIAFVGFKGQVGVIEDLAGDDGANWIGYSPAGASTDPRSVQEKLRDMVSVKDYGAVGDGVTDDTAAIQAAINAVGSNPLYFPPGSYKTTATIYTSYGVNSFLWGGSVYCGAAITAHHSDHIFQYNFSVTIQGIGFYRDNAYRTAAIANQKNGIHSDDTGGVIAGAAYTRIENCTVGPGSYTGIRMHGTWQMAINNVAGGCSIGMALYGGVHLLQENACEDNTITSLLITGNGHRVLSHYADYNCSSGTANYGVVTLQNADMCVVQGVQFNDANGTAAHLYLDRCRRSWIGNCSFYNTSPRVTLRASGGSNTFNNDFTSLRYAPAVTQEGSSGDCYGNYFPPGTTYAGALTNQDRGYNNLHTYDHIVEIVTFIPSVAASTSYDAWSGKALPSGAQYMGVRGFQAEFLNNAELRVLGASITANGAGVSKTVDLSLKVRDVYNNNDLATLTNLNQNEQYGAWSANDTLVAGITNIGGWAGSGIPSWWNFYLINNSGSVTADNVVIRITCAYRTIGLYV